MAIDTKHLISYGSSCVFINPTITIDITPELTINADLQVICSINTPKSWKWTYDDIEVLNIRSIKYSGFDITDENKIDAFVKHYKQIGIDIWSMLNEESEKIVLKFDVADFIEQFTSLRAKN